MSKKIGKCSHKCAGKGKRAKSKCMSACMKKGGSTRRHRKSRR